MRSHLKFFFAHLLFISIFFLSTPASHAQTPTRLTNYQGNDLTPAWDPRGNAIAYVRQKNIGGNVYEAYQVLPNQAGSETALLTGLNTDFGVSVNLSWIGTTGFLADEEAISGFEFLKFNTAVAPFNRTQTNGPDTNNSVLLNVPGGGGFGLIKISRDGTTALIRANVGSNISVRSGLVSSMTAQASNTFGTAVQAVTGADDQLRSGGALTPNGSQYVIPLPITNEASGHDLVIGSTAGGATTKLTNNGAQGYHNVFPDISPDGTKIAFARRDPGANTQYDLFVMNIDGTKLTQLTSTPFFAESHPSWSPDGTQLAFDGVHVVGHESDAPALAPNESANDNIYVIPLSVAPTPTPIVPTPTPTPGVVAPNTKLLIPPTVVVSRRNATFRFQAFSRGQIETVSRAVFGRAAASRARVSFKYDLALVKGRSRTSVLSTRNSVTVRNLSPGAYTSNYRIQITSKTPGKRDVVKNTGFSPRTKFTISK